MKCCKCTRKFDGKNAHVPVSVYTVLILKLIDKHYRPHNYILYIGKLSREKTFADR